MPATDKLIAGYQRFRKDYYEKNKLLLTKLASQGQFPKIAIISCCDSRVDPTIILDCKPGDLFVIRNVANLVPPCETDDSHHGTSAALEFAVTGLNVESIIVLGHTQCGGIKALMDNEPSVEGHSFISKWMKQLNDVRDEILCCSDITTNEERYDACERRGIIQSLENLMTFPWIRSRVQAGSLRLHGWYYDLNTSGIYVFNQEKEDFLLME